MFILNVDAVELYDEKENTFLKFPGETLLLEHSLVSLSKWESLTKKPFLGHETKTREETIEYIKCMTFSPVNSPDVYDRLSSDNFNEISAYIDDSMTATWFNETRQSRTNGEVITAEIIYYWMTALQVPTEYQYWHLNRLLTLIRVINLKNAPAKKMGKKETIEMQRSLNADRRARFAKKE